MTPLQTLIEKEKERFLALNDHEPCYADEHCASCKHTVFIDFEEAMHSAYELGKKEGYTECFDSIGSKSCP